MIVDWLKAHIYIAAILGLFFLATAYFVGVFLEACWRLRHFRGPFALPLIGNFYNVNNLISLFKFLGNTRKTHGKIFVTFLFTRSFLIVLDPVIVRRILSDTKVFPKGHNYSNLFSLIFGLGLVTSDHDKHRQDRGIFGKYFIRSNIAKIVPNVNSLTLEAFDQFIGEPLKNQNIISVNCEDIFARLALRVFMNFSINWDYRSNPKREEEICHLVSKASYYMGLVVAFSIPKWSFLPTTKLFKKVREEIWSDVKVLIEKRKIEMAENAKTGKENIDDCITAMITENLNETDIIDHATTLICAGHDTTAFFACYIALVLAENPEVQTKLRDVINKQLGDRTEITADDIAEMKYLSQVMHETLRVYAIIPNVSRVCVSDMVIKEADNVLIPKNTEIIIPMYLMNRDPAIWDNPTTFDPSRWEGKGEYTSAKDGFFPFGYGSRTCIGNLLAQIESAIFISHLLRQYEILPEPGFKVNVVAGISLTTSNGVRVRFRKL